MIAAMLGAAACGGDDGLVLVDDAAPNFCPQGCNPLAPAGQQGCSAGKRCGAIVLADGACAGVVRVHCVPVGMRAIGEQCVYGAAGVDTGYDDCVTGAVCAGDGTCRAICSFTASTCAAPLACVMQAGLFEPGGGGKPAFGVCAPPI